MRLPDPRHRAERVRVPPRPHGDVNTVAMPWVDFNHDLADIRASRCVRDGNRFVVSGREYVMEGDGRLFPTTGEGLHQLGRGAYRALAWYNSYGLTAAVEDQLVQDLVTEDERERAREIWRTLQDWRQRRV